MASISPNSGTNAADSKPAEADGAHIMDRDDDIANLRLIAAVKRFPKIAGFMIAVCPAILLFGFDMVIVSTLTAMPYFQKDYGVKLGSKYIIPSSWLGVWTAAPPLGNMIGAGAAGWVSDHWGRRSSFVIGAFISAVGIAICFASAYPLDIEVRRGMFLLGKLMEGIAAGQVICTVQTYLSEVAPLSLRGPSQALIPLMTLLGQLVGALVVFACLSVDSRWGYLIPLASQWFFSVILTVIAIIIPESPPYLARVGKLDSTLKSLKRLHRADVDMDAVFRKLCAVLEQERYNSHINGSEVSLVHCFKGTDLRRTMIVLIAHMMPQFFGLGLLSNASYFGQTIGMKPFMSVLLLEIGIAVGLVANIISVWTLSVARRRPLMLVTLGMVGVLWTSIGISGCFDSPVTMWYTAVSMIFIIFIGGSGVWPASVLVASETSSLRLRAQTQAIGWVLHSLGACVFAIVLPYIYNTDQGNLGAKTGFIYLFFCILSFALVFLYVPEMRGRSAAQLDNMFSLRLRTRKFRDWPENDIDDIKEEVNIEMVEDCAREN
ncbi:hypothetical protein AJ80_07919 [Polytolypa hystricis UAMH7299]|uniref:Major facilitator superfamily (MFS) profile domain-containing protein n=1 Tax=Polytolypa hystricis (strain UAMH7299) TaxID=1447883 RepID=A0A2B7XGS3_POLH7|nr:hypothetical protein AJ80_07919 [Polytolypa hystricis UAMH7299]